jgi:hypothetical protein
VDGNIAVGELIAEIADEDRQAVVPAVCLAEARARMSDGLAAAHLLLLLTTTPTIRVERLAGDRFGRADPIWRVGEFALEARGDVGIGHAFYAALTHEAYVATARPDAIAGVLPEGWIVLDLR